MVWVLSSRKWNGLLSTQFWCRVQLSLQQVNIIIRHQETHLHLTFMIVVLHINTPQVMLGGNYFLLPLLSFVYDYKILISL